MKINKAEPAKGSCSKAPELLAPAGSFLCLKAAVQNGADAVYLGLKTGSARMGAENFTFDELKAAVEYSHIRGVSVYLAINTLFFENEINDAYEAAKKAADTGVDALIIQDMGLAEKIACHRELFPCELHASTQMSIYNTEGLSVLRKLGFSRCITARELSIHEIHELCDANIMDIEVFCHGALCMSMSGQCLLSSFIGGRSGNRGNCAQPCRMKYALSNNGMHSSYAYRLSPSDLASLPYLEALISTGVASLKIEGRLKSPYYVAMTTRFYREAIDAVATGGQVQDIEAKMRDMQTLFGRGEFTSGYLLGKLPFKAVTMRSSGRTGALIGSAENIKKLPAPPEIKNKLEIFTFTASFYSHDTDCKKNDRDYNGIRILNKGDGFTIYRREKDLLLAAAGGTVNKIERINTDNKHKICKYKITAAGSLSQQDLYGRHGRLGRLGSTDRRGKYSENACQDQNNAEYLIYLTDDAALRAREEVALNNKENKENKKIPVKMYFTAKKGEKPSLTIYDERGNKFTSTGSEVLNEAKSAPADADSIRARISKLGDTPYELKEADIQIENGLFIPAGNINKMRRECTDGITMLRKAPLYHLYKKHSTDAQGAHIAEVCKDVFGSIIGGGISVFYYNTPCPPCEWLERFNSYISIFHGGEAASGQKSNILAPYMSEKCTHYIPLSIFSADFPSGEYAASHSCTDLYNVNNEYKEKILYAIDSLKKLKKKYNFKIAAYMPFISLGRALHDTRSELYKIVRCYTCFSDGDNPLIDGFMCENAGDITLLHTVFEKCIHDIPSNMPSMLPFVCADYSFNITNSSSLLALSHMGVASAAISPEASQEQLEHILIKAKNEKINIIPEIIVDGRIILMRSRHCYIDEGKCSGKKGMCTSGTYSLIDEHGAEFPIIPQKSDCCSILLSHRPLNFTNFTNERIKRIRGIYPDATLRINTVL